MVTSQGSNVGIRRVAQEFLRSSLVAAITLGLAGPAASQDWEIEPALEFVATYTDNLYLTPDGTETSSFVGQINPAILLQKDQGRFITDTGYRLQSVYFTEDSDLNGVFHNLNSSSTLALISDRFFIDINATIDQAVIDPRASIPTTNVVITDNLGDVYIGDLNPYFITPLGSRVFLRLDYEWGIGRYDGFGLDDFSRVDDYTRDGAGFYLGTGQQESGFEWSLMYDGQEIDYEVVEDFRFERAQIAIGVPVTPQFRLVGMAGQESDLLVSRQAGGLDSDFWEAGFRVNVGRQKSFEARVGERFFGTSYFGDLRYDGRRLSASVTYSENPTTSALDGLGSLVIPFADGFEGPEPPSEDDINIGPIRSEAYIARTLNARIEWSGNKSSLFASLFSEDREFFDEPDELGGTQDGQDALTVGFSYELGPRTEAEISAAVFRYGYAGTDVSTDLKRINLGVVRLLGRSTDLRFVYRHVLQDTDSVSGFNNYTENAVDVWLVKRF